jgi:hypothetical protein
LASFDLIIMNSNNNNIEITTKSLNNNYSKRPIPIINDNSSFNHVIIPALLSHFDSLPDNNNTTSTNIKYEDYLDLNPNDNNSSSIETLGNIEQQLQHQHPITNKRLKERKKRRKKNDSTKATLPTTSTTTTTTTDEAMLIDQHYNHLQIESQSNMISNSTSESSFYSSNDFINNIPIEQDKHFQV